MPYLFTHFKEKLTIDGEQVYFALSKDGFNWEQVNGGEPVLTSKMSSGGCRDIEKIQIILYDIIDKFFERSQAAACIRYPPL